MTSSFSLSIGNTRATGLPCFSKTIPSVSSYSVWHNLIIYFDCFSHGSFFEFYDSFLVGIIDQAENQIMIVFIG